MDLEARRKLRLVLRSELLYVGELSGNAVVGIHESETAEKNREREWELVGRWLRGERERNKT